VFAVSPPPPLDLRGPTSKGNGRGEEGKGGKEKSRERREEGEARKKWAGECIQVLRGDRRPCDRP